MVFNTSRLILRHLSHDDAPFMYKLLNDPSWIRFIGDRNINTIEDAKNHIQKKYISSYAENGYGLYLVEKKINRQAIGVCGLINRPSLANVDIGFAFLPEHTGNGYAYEAALATLKYGYKQLKLEKIVAITITENERSINLLKKLGFRNEGITINHGEENCMLFVPSKDEKL